MAGRGSLAGLMPYGDANAIVVEMAAEVLPVVRHTPVLAGVCATDPFRLMDRFLDQLRAIGFAGVQNFPTVGLIDGTFRANLEETGMGYGLEVDMIAKAHARGMLTTPYVFDEGSAADMARAGADIIVIGGAITKAVDPRAATSDIRKAIVEADLVDCMVALPGQLFTNTQIPACLWFLARAFSPSWIADWKRN